MAGAEIVIRPAEARDRDPILDLSIRAWTPVFETGRPEMLHYVFDAFYPEGWEARQRADIAAVLEDGEAETFVAEEAEHMVGFVTLRRHPEDRMGEINVIAVDPEAQGRGIAARLIAYAEDRLRAEGFEIIMVETGGDSGHAPARRAYEASGFEQWPVARYFKKL